MTRRELAAYFIAFLIVSAIVSFLAAMAGSYLAGVALAASRPAQLAVPVSGQERSGVDVPLPAPGRAGLAGQPDSHPGAPTASPHPGRITPSPSPIGMRPAAVETPRTAPTLRGIATWFDSPSGVSAAGPALRAALGPGWRGQSVRVCAASGCVTTVLGDWMRADRLIDLHAPLFAALAPLSVGILRVTVTPVPAPPETSTP